MRWCLSISLLLLYSCSKEDITVEDLGYNYYPLEVGMTKVYAIDSLVLNDFTLTTDTYQFEYKDVVQSKFEDAGGRTVYRIERFRSTDKQNWTIKKAYLAHKDNSFVEEQMDNLREVKLSFPIRQFNSWDGNARNTLEKEDYTITHFVDTILEGVTYTNSISVEQAYETDPLQINTRIKKELYGTDKGLIHQYWKLVKRRTTGVPGDPVIDSGLIFSLRLKSIYVE